MKFRPQRGTLAASIAELVDLEPTREALAAHLKIEEPSRLKVEPYGFDERISWHANIVFDDSGVYGFTDSPVRP